MSDSLRIFGVKASFFSKKFLFFTGAKATKRASRFIYFDWLALYMFQLSEVLKAVAVEGDIWDFLLSRFPYARIDR